MALDEETGKIAVSTGHRVYIYQPFGEDEGALKWSQQSAINSSADPTCPCSLSWGPEEEILVGSSTLELHQLAFGDSCIWRRPLSSPTSLALLSTDAAFIASFGRYDRLVKIWRRLFFGSQDVDFDYSYLAHPAAVTSAQWRRKREAHHGAEQVLYTTCANGKVRIWTMTNPHTLPVFQLWAEMDLRDSIQPRQLDAGETSDLIFALFLDGLDFFEGLEAAQKRDAENPFLDHLITEIGEEKADVCVILDAVGHMSAWGLRNVGRKPTDTADVFNIGLVEELLPKALCSLLQDARNAHVFGFGAQGSSAILLLVHVFGEGIAWLQGDVAEAFNPAPSTGSFHTQSLWTGHSGTIKKINRTRRGRAVVSRTGANQAMLWKQSGHREGGGLVRCSTLDSPDHVHRSCMIAGGNLVVNLHHDGISLWDTQELHARKTSSCSFDLAGKPLCLLLLPPPENRAASRFVATVFSNMSGIVWQITIPPLELQNRTTDSRSPRIQEFTTFNLGPRADIEFVLAIDPAGSAPVVTGFLDTFAKDIALTYTTDGTLSTWTAKVDLQKSAVRWFCTATVPTGIHQPSLASGTSNRKVALVSFSRNGLSIWDTKSAELEYEKIFNAVDVIQDLDWTSTPDDQSVLAVGFPHKVLIMAQIRYDYLDRGPAWAAIREISIRNFTPHPIGDSTWLGEGNLVIGAGTQLFMYDRIASVSEGMTSALSATISRKKAVDLFDIVSVLNGPLPLFHPQFLSQLIQSGRMSQAQKILVQLNQRLKFWTEGDPLESWLSISPDDLITRGDELSASQPNINGSTYSGISGTSKANSVTEDIATELNDSLAKKSLPFLSRREQFALANLIECVATAEKERRSMDANAAIFTLFFRAHSLLESQATHGEDTGISWREIVWAFHSGSQDMLIDQVSCNYQGHMRWPQARASGLFMWISDVNVLRQQLEAVARNEYTRAFEKDPVDCSLYYVALRKKNVLLGLWRMATWHREQASTQRLLANNFGEARWKTAALKNAYALLSRRRFAYAATFFLLAGQLRDAVSILAQQVGDIQLAVAIARAHEGDGGPVLTELLEQRVLLLAAFEGNRWMASWAFWMLGQRDMAVRALITPVHILLDRCPSPSQQARLFLATDPALVVMYRQLREKTLQTLWGATQVSPREEWEFVMRMARLYDRMGCDILALDLGEYRPLATCRVCLRSLD